MVVFLDYIATYSDWGVRGMLCFLLWLGDMQLPQFFQTTITEQIGVL